MADQELEIRVRNCTMLIKGELSQELRDKIRLTLSYIVPGFKYMPQYKRSKRTNHPWDGTMTTVIPIPGVGFEAPTGLLSYVREILAEAQIPYNLYDDRCPVIRTTGYTHNVSLRDYQRKAVDAMLNRGRGVLKASTGAGKTEIVIAGIVEASAYPAIFYVTSCDLLRQAYNRFKKYVTYNGLECEIGRIGDGYCDIKPITIATIQSCERALTGEFTAFDDCSADDKTKLSDQQKLEVADLVRQAQFVYVDECQHVSSQTVQTILNQSTKARLRVGGSASPWRDDGLDILIEAAFGRKFCDISASFLIEKGFLLKPEITFNHFKQALGDAETFAAHYTKYVVENEARNKWIGERALFHVERNRPTIILVKWVKHAQLLADLIPGAEILSSSGDSKKSPKKREEILNKMRTREVMCIIGTSLLDEGVDVPCATAGIFAGGGKSSTRELQRVGRFIRADPLDPQKDRAYIEEFYDHTSFLMHHTKLRRKILLTEPEFEINDNRETLKL